MSIFDYKNHEVLGTVKSVDTSNVIVTVSNLDLLRQLQVNRLVALRSSKPGQHLIGIVQRITRQSSALNLEDSESEINSNLLEVNVVKIALIGTLIDKVGAKENVFRRTLETVPEIEAQCFPIEKSRLSSFMRAISEMGSQIENKLSVGHYTLDEEAEAFLNGNKFFQRHAVVVGSTGSGKSWTTALLVEQIANLSHANAILFDVHGEYGTLKSSGVSHLKVAGPADGNKSLDAGILHLPYWLLKYEEMIALLLDRSDQNAPNQAMLFSKFVFEAKEKALQTLGEKDLLANFTVDSPIPYDLNFVMKALKDLDSEMVEGARGQKQGEFYGKLSRFLLRLDNKITDRRLGFMFGGTAELRQLPWLEKLARNLICGSLERDTVGGGVKIIDFSEVPSDILPLIISLVGSLVFSIQQWTSIKNRHPISIFCDEAHLYMPQNSEASSLSGAALKSFERIAKEGRKYGVGLVVISQRPSEVNRTILSQCNNFIAMRLSNSEDQTVVKKLLPDSLSGFTELLPVLDVGEALVVGDASLLPSRVRISKPNNQPNSMTIEFWDRWSINEKVQAVNDAVLALRKQSQEQA